MIVTTEAIVLRARKQGETSKIVTLYTREFGKVSVIAKGAREMKSKFGGALEMFALSTVVFYKRDTHDALNLLSKAEIVDSNRGIVRSLTKMESATAVLELVLQAMHDEEAQYELFALLQETLHSIAQFEDELSAYFKFRFYVEFAKEMGFEFELDRATGIAPRIVTILETISEGRVEEFLPLQEQQGDQLQLFFQSYFAEHFPGITLRSLKSNRVFGKL